MNDAALYDISMYHEVRKLPWTVRGAPIVFLVAAVLWLILYDPSLPSFGWDIFVSVMLVDIVLIAVLQSFGMGIEINTSGLSLKYRPIRFRGEEIAIENIKSCREAVFGELGQANYTKVWRLSGLTGVSLEMTNGERYFIGTANTQGFAEALDSARKTEPCGSMELGTDDPVKVPSQKRKAIWGWMLLGSQILLILFMKTKTIRPEAGFMLFGLAHSILHLRSLACFRAAKDRNDVDGIYDWLTRVWTTVVWGKELPFPQYRQRGISGSIVGIAVGMLFTAGAAYALFRHLAR